MELDRDQQLVFRVTLEEKKRFKSKLASEGVTMNQKLREFLFGYLSEVEEARIKQAS